MKKKDLTFKDVYQLPLRIDDFCAIYVLSANNVTTFTIIVDDFESDRIKHILSIINGDSEDRFENVEYRNGYINIDGKHVLLARGWGHLTDTMGLSERKAAQIQDEFCEWVVKRLKGE